MKLRGFVMFLLLGWFILILQSTVVSYITYGVFQPELLLVILVHGGVYRRGADGIVLALSYGHLMDLFSGRPHGTFLFIYILLFLLARVLSIRLLLQSKFMQLVLIFVFSLIGELILFALSRFTALPQGVGLDMRGLFIRSGVNAAAAWVLFPFLGWLERRVWTRPKMLHYG